MFRMYYLRGIAAKAAELAWNVKLAGMKAYDVRLKNQEADNNNPWNGR